MKPRVCDTRVGNHMKESVHLNRWAQVRDLWFWVRKEFSPSAGSPHKFGAFYRKARRVYQTRGMASFIAWLRAKGQLYRKFLEDPDGPNGRKLRLKVYWTFGKQGSEIALKTSCPDSVRLTETVLTSYRCFHLPIQVDTGPITDPSTGEVGDWSAWVRPFWNALGVPKSFADRVMWSTYRFSLKMGPLGPASIYSLEDLRVIPDSLVESIGILGGQRLLGFLQLLRQNLDAFTDALDLRPLYRKRAGTDKSGTFRKVVGIADGIKTRVIAIADFWTQEAMNPLALGIAGYVRRVRQDVVHDQGAFLEKLRSWGPVKVFSYDLTSATDRFPIGVICQLLEGRFSQAFVNAWRDVMVGYPFDVPQKRVGRGETPKVHYACGTCQGILSSFILFDLAHHLVMFRACKELRIPWKTSKYVILGDDIIIGDEQLAERYRSLILGLGVMMSSTKTLVSWDICEFAKRIIYKTKEVTGFPLNAVLETYKDPAVLASLLVSEERKGLVAQSGISGAIESLDDFLHLPRGLTPRRVARAAESELIMRTLWNQGSAQDLVKGLMRNSIPEVDLEKFTPELSRSILSQACAELLRSSFIVGRSNILEIYFQALVKLSNDDRVRMKGPAVLVAHPLLGSFRAMEERLLRIEGDVLNDPAAVLEEFLLDVGIPLTDQSFGLSSWEKSFKASSRLAVALRKCATEALSTTPVKYLSQKGPKGSSRPSLWIPLPFRRFAIYLQEKMGRYPPMGAWKSKRERKKVRKPRLYQL